ncbi:MAG: T9SS type A sorting domain-containing protein [Candidatus Hatepunaea meridiana]|nr:T9SS type A sorting domain-containing protein [Candidatus Hatepunaea meridiana]
MRFRLVFSLLLLSSIGLLASPPTSVYINEELPRESLISTPNSYSTAPIINPIHPWQPRRDDIIGEAFQAGDTYHDQQSNGSIGKMIAVDSDGNVHVTWMDRIDRIQQKYNCRIDDEWIGEDGLDRSSHGSISLTEEDEPQALLFLHAEQDNQNRTYGWAIITSFLDFRFVDNFLYLPDYQDDPVLWPQGCMSSNGTIHIAGLSYDQEDYMTICYVQAYVDDREELSCDFEDPAVVGSTHLCNFRIARSPNPNSERVAITWLKRRWEPIWEHWAADEWNNDLWMAWTDDGDDWNFDEPSNVTNTIFPDNELEPPECYGDTLFPCLTHDVIFDSEDYIHIIFETRGIWWELGENELRSTNDPYLPPCTVDASYLFHWSEETDEITAVADGWFFQYVFEDDTLRAHPTPGIWKSNVCYPSLAYGENGDLYCVYNYYPPNDHNDYVGLYGRCNGDIAVTVSEDNGASWYYPTMVVETRTHLPEPGEALSECYPTVAEVVDDYLHIFYEVDREAGSYLMNENASATLNPVVYQRIPVDEIRRDSIWNGPNFHVGEQSVSNPNDWTPGGFRLTGVYPNPFNNVTTIEFEVQSGMDIKLDAYNIRGRRVAELYSGKVLSGRHSINWEASDLPAGLYLIKLSTGAFAMVGKVALLK